MKRSLLGWAVLAAVTLPLGMRAQSDDERPERGVARISVLNGDVSVRRGDSGDLVAAALNAPLVVEDRVITGPGSRAEVQFDYANMVRLAGDSEIRMAQLEYKRYILQVARGTVTYRVLRDADDRADVELSTPSVSVRPVQRGEYRITVHDDGTSEITVRSGEAEIFTPRGSQRLRAGRTMLTRGSASDPEFQVVSEIREDEWDRWNERRDRDLERSRSYQYVSRDIYGAEDLDGHGRWVYTPQYGYVWAPYVAQGWAPYRHGRWAWIDWYGWSWVSYDPWGWAPYHYGRWFWNVGHGWCWYPGGFVNRHYWRPALVAFFGFGNVGVGFGWGRVGWVPLAPFEPFHPWYGRRFYGGFRNRTYIDNSVNIVNNVNITNTYRNARVRGGVTGVDADGFGRGRNYVRLADADVGRAALARGPVPVAPARESLRWADREAPATVRASDDNRRFYTSRDVARTERIPFDEQRRSLEQAWSPRVSERTVAEQGTRGSERTDSSWRRVESGRSDAPARTAERSEGWRRLGSERSAERSDLQGRREAPARSSERSSDSWQRFGTRSPDTPVEPGWRGSERRESERSTGAVEGSRRSGEGRSDSWRGFGDPGGAERSVAPSESSRRSGETRSETRSERSWSRGDVERQDRWDRGADRSNYGWGRSEAPRTSPSIVRERSNDGPRMEMPRGGGEMRGNGGGGGGGGMRSEAPRGGGGGGGRVSGGEGRSGGRGR